MCPWPQALRFATVRKPAARTETNPDYFARRWRSWSVCLLRLLQTALLQTTGAWLGRTRMERALARVQSVFAWHILDLGQVG